MAYISSKENDTSHKNLQRNLGMLQAMHSNQLKSQSIFSNQATEDYQLGSKNHHQALGLNNSNFNQKSLNERKVLGNVDLNSQQFDRHNMVNIEPKKLNSQTMGESLIYQDQAIEINRNN